MVMAYLESQQELVRLLDLRDLPEGIFQSRHYGAPPPEFAPFQQLILDAQGLVVVVPEYNGSFPGALKYFIDLLKFPNSLRQMPVAFVGLASGKFGALRAVEQLELVFQYREAHIFAKRIFFPAVEKAIVDGQIQDDFVAGLFRTMLTEFADFARRLRAQS